MQPSYKHSFRAFICFLTFFILTSCATAPKTSKQEMPEEIIPTAETDKEPLRTEEEIKSLETFTEILHITRSTQDRQSILPQIENMYKKIIKDYPEVPLVQESYWRLIAIYVNDHSPPDYEKAETLYSEFQKKFPESYAESFIEDELGKSYYNNGEWSKLMTFTLPTYRDHVEKGINGRAPMIYMYAEANYHLGNLEEAEKGYQIVSELYPQLIEGKKSKLILEKMKKAGKQ